MKFMIIDTGVAKIHEAESIFATITVLYLYCIVLKTVYCTKLLLLLLLKIVHEVQKDRMRQKKDRTINMYTNDMQ